MDKVVVGAPDGKPFFFMPESDASIVQNAGDAARYTGNAPFRNEGLFRRW